MPVLPPGISPASSCSSAAMSDGERHERDHEEPVVEERQRAVDPAAEVAGADADDRPDHGRGEARHDPDDERDARADQELREQVAARLVGAEPVRARRAAHRARSRNELGRERLLRRQQRPEHRHHHDDPRCDSPSARSGPRPIARSAATRAARRRRAAARADAPRSRATVSGETRHQRARTRGSRAVDQVGEQVHEDHGGRREQEDALEHGKSRLRARRRSPARCPATRTPTR